jgi:hypothetical protein
VEETLKSLSKLSGPDLILSLVVNPEDALEIICSVRNLVPRI